MMEPPTLNIQEAKNAAHFLRGWFFNQRREVTLLRKAIEKQGLNWWVPYHSIWGMHIRNLLRTNGYTEEALGIRNLDDIYAVLMEFVVPTMDYSLNYYLLRTETELVPDIRKAVSLAEDFYRKQGF